MSRKQGFTLIELLVVMSIIMVLASMLLLGINAARQAFRRAQCQTEISQMMMAVTQYDTDFGAPPPSGEDSDDNGKISNAGTGIINHGEAWPAGWTSNEHPLVRCLTKEQELKDSNNVVLRTYAPIYEKGKTKAVTDSSGEFVYLVDPYGNPYRYLSDGRRKDRALSRVTKPSVVIWSVGLDGLPDPENDQLDNDPQDGRVDDTKELVDDICSWNS